jgi:hypothetical protein
VNILRLYLFELYLEHEHATAIEYLEQEQDLEAMIEDKYLEYTANIESYI